MKTKKIVDCFTFFNELELLEIRLEYLYDVVDHFVIVESNQGFSGIRKDFILEKNIDKLEKYKDKITYIPLKMPSFKEEKKVAWKREIFQRNGISEGLNLLNIDSEDLVLISDIDEIPNKDKIEKVKEKYPLVKLGTSKILKAIFDAIFSRDANKLKLIKLNTFHRYSLPIPFAMENFLYYINYKEIDGVWNGTVLTKYKALDQFNVDEIRNFRNYCPAISNSGWHFSYLGGIEKIILKLKNYSHQEYNKPEIANADFIKTCIKNGYSLNDYYKGRNIVKYAKIKLDRFPKTLKNIIINYKNFVFDQENTNL